MNTRSSQDATTAPESGRDKCPRLGLCCLFLEEPGVRFRTATARVMGKWSPEVRREKLLDITHANFDALVAAIRACGRLGISAFRVMSGLLPLATHPDYLYGLDDVRPATLDLVAEAARLARDASIRLSFHPDQFVLLGSPRGRHDGRAARPGAA